MSKTKLAIIGLVVALILSNAWWLYKSIDFGVTYTYQQASLEYKSEALTQALALLPIVSDPKSSRELMIQTALSGRGRSEIFEKDGYVWVGRLGLKFDKNGKFVKAVANL